MLYSGLFACMYFTAESHIVAYILILYTVQLQVSMYVVSDDTFQWFHRFYWFHSMVI